MAAREVAAREVLAVQRQPAARQAARGQAEPLVAPAAVLEELAERQVVQVEALLPHLATTKFRTKGRKA